MSPLNAELPYALTARFKQGLSAHMPKSEVNVW
jgi:hypothetical protein